MAKTTPSPNTRQVILNPTDPAYVVLVALGDLTSLRELTQALVQAKITHVRAEELIEQASRAGLVRYEYGTLRWDKPRLHEASLSLATHKLLPPIARFSEVGDYSFAYEGSRRLNAARWAFYRNDEAMLAKCYVSMSELVGYFFTASAEWVSSRRPSMTTTLINHVGCGRIFFADLPPDWQEVLGKQQEWGFAVAVMRGDLNTAADYRKSEVGNGEALWFLQGDAEKAHHGFQKLIKRRKKGPVLHPFAALFAQLAALRLGDPQAALDERYTCTYWGTLQRLLQQVASRAVDPKQRPKIDLDFKVSLGLLFLKVLEPLLPPGALQPFAGALASARQKWTELGLTGLVQQLDPPTTPTHWGYGLGQRTDWENWLAALRTRGQTSLTLAPKTSKVTASYRLAWHLEKQEFFPRKEKLTKSGWSASSISWQTLISKPPDFLSEQDRVVIGKIKRVESYYGAELRFGPEAFRALVGHPALYFNEEPCELSEVPLQLTVRTQKQSLVVETVPKLAPDQGFALLRLGPGRVGLCVLDPTQQSLLALILRAVPIPIEAREQLLESLNPWLDTVELLLPAGMIPEVVGQCQPVVRIYPLVEGLRFEVGVKPGAEHGPFLLAGEGPATLNIKVHQQSSMIVRNLDGERAELAQLWNQCPTLLEQSSLEAREAAEALEVLLQLQNCSARLEWPQHKPWQLKVVSSQQQLRLQALQEGDWFEIRGQIQVDESLQLDVQRLLELARGSRGRFVSLGEGQFLALTEQLKQRLSALDDLVEVHKKKVRLSRLAVSTLAELEVEGDDGFRRCLDQFQQAETYNARIPGALQAELRDYQVEGYRWLARRSKAGAGCCLADDMGLGKTMQTLALLLKEGREGPHLVVCPTSVCSNWSSHITRFAPTLQAVFLEGKQRAQQLEQLGPGCVALCSYRILLQDVELLKKVAWNAVVLDEAQFIKNPDSKTARAAYALKARIRVATTGTPIENRLLELWSIFNFLNPGLLGSMANFQRRFETPSLSGQNSSRQRLRRLVAPFLLRRIKSQVLDELPARTDISLEVELSQPERAAYEALRQQAVQVAQLEQGHLQLLAHLTRLRQACCHPALVGLESLQSSKLETFLQLGEELRDGRHRALVFSQFVGLLQLLREQLDQRGWSYLYLDGSTPAAQRPGLVDKFQEGETDFFLISLKAGGTGLNLTAADYVVHLDPWWNPAAEDQASDRAHRIGQTRPVTVYRLVARDTLEERVVQLHAHKRELAQTVLEGSDAQVRLNAQELLELLRS